MLKHNLERICEGWTCEHIPLGSVADPVFHDLSFRHGANLFEELLELLCPQPRGKLLDEHSPTIPLVLGELRRRRVAADILIRSRGAAATAVSVVISSLSAFPIIPPIVAVSRAVEAAAWGPRARSTMTATAVVVAVPVAA